MSIRDEFPRTTCACEVCQAGCRTMPGSCVPGDVERIAAHLGADHTDIDWLRTCFMASDGAKVLRFVGSRCYLVQAESIVPRQRASGECVFLDEHGRCSIHEVAPAGCAYFDTHQPLPDADERSEAMVREILDANARPAFRGRGFGYGEQVAALKAVGSVAAPLAGRKAAFAALELEIRRKLASGAVETPQV